MGIVLVEVRSVYGTDKVYPVNDAAKHFARLTGTKTFSPSNIADISALGFKIVVAQKELVL